MEVNLSVSRVNSPGKSETKSPDAVQILSVFTIRSLGALIETFTLKDV